MAQRITIHSNLQEAKDAKKLPNRNHTDGFVPLHTDKTQTGYKIIWDNTPTPIIPRRQLTERQLLDELALERNAEII